MTDGEWLDYQNKISECTQELGLSFEPVFRSGVDARLPEAEELDASYPATLRTNGYGQYTQPLEQRKGFAAGAELTRVNFANQKIAGPVDAWLDVVVGPQPGDLTEGLSPENRLQIGIEQPVAGCASTAADNVGISIDLSQADQFEKKVEELVLQVDSTPDVRTAWLAWSQCMARADYAFATRADASRWLGEQAVALSTSIGSERTQIVQDTATLQNGASVMVSFEGLTEVDRLMEKNELDLAGVDAGCDEQASLSTARAAAWVPLEENLRVSFGS